MIFRAYAKINIGLRILGKRSDGYHDIETIFHQINLCDELAFQPCETVKLSTSSSDVPHDSRNLCVRAAELLRTHTGRRDGVDIQLTKRVPVGSGLGGGSSDAALVLTALNQLWSVKMPEEELSKLAAKLGSDVAFFVTGGTALGTSRGEVLEHFRLRMPYWILTATPAIHVSTAWAYANVRPNPGTMTPPLRAFVEKHIDAPDELRPGLHNDFEDVVFQRFPVIAQLRDTLDKAGAVFSQMSGSGSSVFGFFRTRAEAEKAGEKLASACVTSLTAPDFQPTQNRTITL